MKLRYTERAIADLEAIQDRVDGKHPGHDRKPNCFHSFLAGYEAINGRLLPSGGD